MKSYRFRGSVAHKILGGFLLLTFLIILTQSVFVTYGLEEFYKSRKIVYLKRQLTAIETLYDTVEDTEERQEALWDISAQAGGSVLIYNEETKTYLNMGERYLPPLEFWASLDASNEDFYTCRVVGSQSLKGLEWLICAQKMKNGEWAIIEIPFRSIEEAVDVFQAFFIYMIILAVGFSLILSIYISRMITRPLIKLNYLAKEIQKLNFSVRYEGNEVDEISNLGNTFNLMNQKLEETITMLRQELAKEKQLKDLRKQFTAQVSHELKTPISIIKGYVEALRDDVVDSPEEREYYLSVINEETDKMSNMISQLLDLTKFQTGNSDLELETFPFGEYVNEILLKYDKILSENEIRVEFVDETEGSTAVADRLRMEQVITNLLNNAIKYTGSGETIKITLTKSKNFVVFRIWNNGPPIPEEDLPHVWETFYRGKNKKGGSGLGLAIAREILDHHGSNYYIRNIHDGVEAGFTLPISIQVEGEEEHGEEV